VSSYRYCFLKADGKVQSGINIEADNDEHALHGAAVLEYSHGMEVWQDKRLVGKVPPCENHAR
jgi:hypothetical protein